MSILMFDVEKDTKVLIDVRIIRCKLNQHYSTFPWKLFDYCNNSLSLVCMSSTKGTLIGPIVHCARILHKRTVNARLMKPVRYIFSFDSKKTSCLVVVLLENLAWDAIRGEGDIIIIIINILLNIHHPITLMVMVGMGMVIWGKHGKGEAGRTSLRWVRLVIESE